MTKYIGIDIGGTKIAGGIVDAQGIISLRKERPTPIKEGGRQILHDSIELAKELLSSAKETVHSIGVGAGGQIDSKNGLVFSATDVIPGWKGIHITEAFTKELGLPSAADNDVNVLGLAESRFGAAAMHADGTIVFLALGTGVGGALLVNGNLHHGAHFSGGEFGHILLSMDPDARKDTGGARGTLEAYCSGPGLVLTYKELSGHDSSDLNGHDVVDDMKKHPEGNGQKAITRTGEYLGFGLASLANALDPDLIIIGGGLSELGEAILEPARKILQMHALPGPATCPVVTAKLGIDAAIVGAACLVMEKKGAKALSVS